MSMNIHIVLGMARMTVSLPADLAAFVSAEKAAAGHENASLVVKNALLLLRAKRARHEKHMRTIRKARPARRPSLIRE